MIKVSTTYIEFNSSLQNPFEGKNAAERCKCCIVLKGGCVYKQCNICIVNIIFFHGVNLMLLKHIDTSQHQSVL